MNEMEVDGGHCCVVSALTWIRLLELVIDVRTHTEE
jgi:hypothetical protein